MKATGIIRRLDDLGRIVIPKELRRTLNVGDGDPMEFYTNDEGGICLKKYQSGCCTFCGNTEHLWQHRKLWVCQKCVDILAECATPKALPEPESANIDKRWE